MKYLLLLIPVMLYSQVPESTINALTCDSTFTDSTFTDSTFTVKIETRYDTTEVYMVIPVYRKHFQWGGRWKEVCQLELVSGTRIRKTDNFSLGHEDKFYYKKKEIFPLFSFTKQWKKDNTIRLYEE